MTQLIDPNAARQRVTYHDLPPHPPLDERSRDEHAVESPPALPPADPPRIRVVAGGVLAAATVAVMVGLTGWALARDDGPVPASVSATTVAPTTAAPQPLSPPASRPESDAVPPERLDRLSPFLGPDGELQIPEGRLPGGVEDLMRRLTELGIPSPDLVLPDEAVVRGMSFLAEEVDGERQVGLSMSFELGSDRFQLTASTVQDLPDGTAIDLDGTPGVVDDQGRVVWRTAAGTLTFTLEGRGVDQDRVVEVATEIERAMP